LRSIPTCVGLTSARQRLWEAGTWSIPTCVGLTLLVNHGARSAPVHPHVRGAHDTRGRPWVCQGGPSPRAWGSRKQDLVVPEGPRSIPTCVGLTLPEKFPNCIRAVHPHVRGAHRS